MVKKSKKPVIGQACKITRGLNKGKVGKYVRGWHGELYCEGDYWFVDCGSPYSDCENAEAQVSISEYVATDGTVVNEFSGLFEVEDQGIFDYNVIVDADTGETRKISAVPIAGTSLKDLRESESELERRVAGLIESHLEGGYKE